MNTKLVKKSLVFILIYFINIAVICLCLALMNKYNASVPFAYALGGTCGIVFEAILTSARGTKDEK